MRVSAALCATPGDLNYSAIRDTYPLLSDARRQLEGPLFRREDLPADEATRDRVLVAAMGSPTAQIDGLGRRASADEQGRHRLAGLQARRGSRFPVRAVVSRTRTASTPRRTAATCSPRVVPSRSRPASCRRVVARPHAARADVEQRQALRAAVQTPGRRVSIRRRRRASTAFRARPRRSSCNFLDAAGSVAPGLLPTGRVARLCRRRRSDLHRQRHAGGDAARAPISASRATRAPNS